MKIKNMHFRKKTLSVCLSITICSCAFADPTQPAQSIPNTSESAEIVNKIIESTQKKQETNQSTSMPVTSSQAEVADSISKTIEVNAVLTEEQSSAISAVVPNIERVNSSSSTNEADIAETKDLEPIIVEPIILVPGQEVATSVDNSTVSITQQSTSEIEVFDIKGALVEKDSSVSILFTNELSELYTQYPHKIWINEEEIKEFKQQLVLMGLAGIDKQYSEWIIELNNPNISSSDKELILSDAMLGYLNFVENVNKNKDTWLYQKNSYKVNAASNEELNRWLTSLKNKELKNYIVSLRPQHTAYEPMLNALLNSASQNSVEWPQIQSTKSIKPNAVSDEVASVEFILNYYGLLNNEAKVEVNEEVISEVKPVNEAIEKNSIVEIKLPEVQESTNFNKSITPISDAAPTTLATKVNVYDERLVEGVKKFQSSLGLTADGVIGPQTRTWLNTSPSEKISLIALNMQRLRLIPSDVSTGILVNIPDYSLKFYKDGELILDSRVIVGSIARKTPIMTNEINRVVINPPWSVPTRLAREDIAPKGIKDPHYFVRNGYSLVDLSDGQPIDVDDVLWENVSASNFPFAVRQKPGAGNSLGRYKFDMPNDQAIYLHDTPNHALFDRDVRAISSGCVRVNKSTELANLLLNLEQWDKDKVANTVKKGQTTPVNLSSKVPVELYYLTAWPNEEGQIQYRADIYGYDKLITNAINEVPVANLL
ncbi:L,D-transpeptidase [Thorsellia kenyensis]|uniref:L,D-transpeptidase n=1 Tax=Thorsellia kenyensis TaxID=1549888 RepID=A0ABV6CBM1_9GAMM